MGGGLTFRLVNQALHLFAAAMIVATPFFMVVIMIPRLEAQGVTSA